MRYRRPLIRLALPILLLALTQAQAQNSVMVYGVADVTIESARGGTGSSGRVSSNSSVLGFRGSESLGNGLSAIFQVEGGASLDTGAGGLNTRDTFVGLTGAFGTFKMGLFSPPMRALSGRVSFVPGGSSVANNLGLFTTLNGVQTNLNSRLQNAIQYATPQLGAFNGTFIYAPGENKSAGRNDYTYGAGMAYTQGPVYVGYAYETRRAQQRLALGDSNDWEHRIATRCKAGATTFGLAWDRLASDGLYGAGALAGNGAIERDSWQASMMHVFGANDIMLHYTKNSRLKCSGRAVSGQCAPLNVGETGASQFTVMYHYILSKRTMIQAYASAIRNGARAVYDLDVNPVQPAIGARTPGADPKILGIGVRHHF